MSLDDTRNILRVHRLPPGTYGLLSTCTSPRIRVYPMPGHDSTSNRARILVPLFVASIRLFLDQCLRRGKSNTIDLCRHLLMRIALARAADGCARVWQRV